MQDDARFLHGGQAVLGFEALGTNAVSAIPRLLLLATNQIHDEVPVWATRALASTGPTAFPQLLQIITNRHAMGRLFALIPLPTFGSNALPAVPALLQCVDDPDSAVSFGAMQALCKMSLPTNTALVTFSMCLKANYPWAKGGAAQALGRLGPLASSAAPALQALLTNNDSYVRIQCTNALLKIAPDLLTNAPAQ
jgi:hypothetical protein